MNESDRRASERHPVLIDVIIAYDGKKHQAELRDVSASGVGLVLTTDAFLKNGSEAVIEIQESSLAVSSLSGKLRTESQPAPYRPNARSAGFHVDATHTSSLNAMMESCERKPIPNVEVGFLRAWNMLSIAERTILRTSFETFQVMSADAAQIAVNLMKDPNCSASRLFGLMKLLFQGVQANSGVTTFDVLEKAFLAYRLKHSIEHMEKDRLIKYELGSSRLASV